MWRLYWGQSDVQCTISTGTIGVSIIAFVTPPVPL